MIRYSRTIDRYKAYEMDPQEKQHFEADLNTNVLLAREKKLDDDIDAMLQEEDVIDFRKQLIEVYNNEAPNIKTPYSLPLHRKKWYLATASVLVLLVVSGALLLLKPESNEKLFKKYYNTELVIHVSRSGNTQLIEALHKYQQKQFAEASVLFDDVLKRDESNITVRFYSGISSIETRQYEKAINAFQFIIAHQDNLFVEHARWFLGLTYLKKDFAKEAAKAFNEIANEPENYYRHQAKEILTKLHYDDS